MSSGIEVMTPAVFVACVHVPNRLCVVTKNDEVLYLGPLNALPLGELPAGSLMHISERDYEAIARKTKPLKQIGEVLT